MKRQVKQILALMLGVWLFPAAAAAAVNAGESDFSNAVKEAFADAGESEEIELEFFGGQTSFSMPEASAFKIMITDLKINKQMDRFSCHAELYADGKLFAATDLSGKFYRLENVYVPSRSIRKGEIIREEDLKQITVRRGRIKSVNVTDKEKILGKEAKRMLKEEKLIVENDIGEQIIIRKGEAVTALYATPHMQITAKVEALEDGAKGDKIELLNIKSKKTLYGEVLNADTVKIDVQ